MVKMVILLTDRWFGESDLASSNKGYTGYREVLGGIGGPNQANLEAKHSYCGVWSLFLGDLRIQ